MLFDYDINDEKSIISYAKKMEGMTYNDILTLCKDYLVAYDEGKIHNRNDEFVNHLRKEKFINKDSAKGQLGNFIELYYFGYVPNGNQDADLSELGIEIKQTPIDLTKTGEMTAGERLSITNISYNEPVEDDFYKSHVWKKIHRILLVQYIRDKSINRLDNKIKYVNLFTPPEEDIKIIIDDYEKIISKIKQGKAHEISEGDTMYLGASTKGATAASSIRYQYYGNHIPAKKRNFCFKRGYMNYVLNNYIMTNKVPYESIIKNINDLNNTSFEDYIISKINVYKGKSKEELFSILNYNMKQGDKENKAIYAEFAYRMLGISSNRAKEFIQADIEVKAIRVEKDGKIREHMSFPTFKSKELIRQEWEESDICNFFENKKFLFVVYKNDGITYRLEGAQLWNMPYTDLENIVQYEWLAIRDRYRKGITFTVTRSKVLNNLPNPTDSKIIHVRPHAQKAYFRLKSGYCKGDNPSNGDELQNGEWMTKQCFWLNKEYIMRQLSIK